MDIVDLVLKQSLFVFVMYSIGLIFFISVWIFVIMFIRNILKRMNNKKYFKNSIIDNTPLSNNKSKYYRNYNDVSKKELEKFNVEDINVLKDYFYEIFVDFENAYNNLDYNSMKLLTTKQLYQKYYTGISLDLKTGKKRIIKDIKRNKVIIFELDSTTLKQIATTMIEISYITYKLDNKGNIISGSNINSITEKFEVSFRKDFNSNDVTVCKNCGAEMIGKKCEYCGSSIKDVKFRISSIRKIIE